MNERRLWALAAIALVLFVGRVRTTAFYSEDGSVKKPNTTIISDVLDRLTDSSKYDKRLRPRYGDKPVDVGITIHVSSISAVSEVDMDFTLDFYLRQTWQDPRLAYGKFDLGLDKIESLTVGVDYLDKLWKPDTFFPNEKKSFFHLATTHNSFLRIDPDGTVFTSQRLTVTATCPMKLQLFPMDSQKCKLEIESYGYSVLDINYIFNGSKAISRSEFELPQFVLYDVQITSKIESLSSGKYSRLGVVFLFRRNIGFYIIQIYLPSILIVVISWVSFWLSRDATPARVALGVTTVLTMTTLMTTTNAAMPKVSYVKSIDIFLGVSFLMVFSSLLEYAAVGYISKRLKLNEQKRKQSQQTSSPLPLIADPRAQDLLQPYFNRAYKPFYSSVDRNSNLYSRDLVNPPIQPQLKRLPPIPVKEKWAFRPSNIDKYSRVVFPLIFIMFNFAYWMYFYNISDGYTTSDIDYFWGQKQTDNPDTAVAFSDFTLPQFKQTGYRVDITKATTSSGVYVRLYFEIRLSRNLGFYLMNIIIPSVLIVTISWVSFWLNREASPARVGLGVTTVLTMTTLITTTNNSMPKVSYIKGLDVFLNFCFVMVFASLVEYAVVSYMNKKLAQRREKRRKQAEQMQPMEMPMFNNHLLAPIKTPPNMSYEMVAMNSGSSSPSKSLLHADPYGIMTTSGHPQYGSMNHLVEIPGDCDCRTIPLVQHPRLVAETTLWPAPFGKAKKATKTCRNVTPSKIDKYSRYIFPLSFITFNVAYWTIMTVLSSMSENVNFKAFKEH
ncbi:hypothetical protein QR680_012020 [Steinernema hermaphroditum]|uniref:Uncharacterized protein n=1 Tax=Steinernema hermaphroditum TaxID=289476 RepID=A0AA39I0L7_9BILA|nr:hypothetical protein QR680_012020 [Steinernema hermaphroditum]